MPFAAQQHSTARRLQAQNVNAYSRLAKPGATIAGTAPDPAQATIFLFQRAPDHDHVTGRDLIVEAVAFAIGAAVVAYWLVADLRPEYRQPRVLLGEGVGPGSVVSAQARECLERGLANTTRVYDDADGRWFSAFHALRDLAS